MSEPKASLDVSRAVFTKLQQLQPENRKCFDCSSNAPTWASPKFGIYICLDCSSIHRELGVEISFVQSTTMDQVEIRYLRAMTVGGNASATAYFVSKNASSVLKNKDARSKYTSSAAIKYKAELLSRVEQDRRILSDEDFIKPFLKTDEKKAEETTPRGDEWFAANLKSSTKRTTPPVSRSATPSATGRTPSPFLNAGNGNGNNLNVARSPSPLTQGAIPVAPTASRTTSSAALRKGTTSGAGPRKANILGAKKTKLGAKKLTGDVIDFDAAERKAKEEAERIQKLGYDPEAEEAATSKSSVTSKTADVTQIASPTPVSPGRAGFGAQSRERTNSEMERLGMGMTRLGFGQVGGNKSSTAAPMKMAGFGSVGPTRSAKEDEEEKYARQKFGSQKGISSDEFFGKGSFDPNAQTEAKQRLQGFEGASAISSNQYFGRAEEEDPGEDYGDLETAAKDFVRKFGVTAGDDLDNLTQVLGEGATKLQGAIRSYLNG